MATTIPEDVAKEVESRLKKGNICVPIDVLHEKVKAIGYRFEKGMNCYGVSRYMTGEDAGRSYPANNLYPVQADNGVSAFSIDARRDANYEALKEIRHSFFAVSNGCLVEF